MSVRSLLPALVWASSLTLACANVAPTVVMQSAAMRPGTTLMDVVYRVNDPDDATVKTRALAFVDGERSFAKVLKPVTFVEGTAGNLGNAITANANHTLTWDVGTDWNTDLGQVKFEILCRDGRGLLPIDWITIPAAGGKPTLTISHDTPSDESVLDALFWQYADGDAGLTLANGVLHGNSTTGNYNGIDLAIGGTVTPYAPPFVFMRMNLDPANPSEESYAAETARAGLLNTGSWRAANRPYSGISIVIGFGGNNDGQTTIPSPVGLSGVTAIAGGFNHSLALKADGTVVCWGSNSNGQISIPSGLTGVTAIAAGQFFSLALKNDGTVIGWGNNDAGQTTIPAGLSGVIAIAAGGSHSLALKSNGTVVGWGWNYYGQTTIPASGVKAIAAGGSHSLALKTDGTVVASGWNIFGAITIPAGLSGVTSIAAGTFHSLALKNNGSVVGWGDNRYGQISIPAGLSGITAITAGEQFSLSLKNDGTVVGVNFPWAIPTGLTGVTSISAGSIHGLALKAKAP